MSGSGFFSSPEQQQIVKTKLVAKYFSAWAKIMLPRARNGKIAYIDLFSGPGKFADGKPSTPLWILNHALKEPKLCAGLVTMFNDKEKVFADELQRAIDTLPNIEKLKYKPAVTNYAVGRPIAELLKAATLVPTLFFIDPWGYKGLTLDLVGNAIKSWGCDCIFFFNYNRINMGLHNRYVVEHMDNLFGKARADVLREQVGGLTPDERQAIIVSELQQALKSVGGQYVLSFEFQSSHGVRTSHYIMFVSKDDRGYNIMKDIMYKLSTDSNEVRSFVYAPVRAIQLALGIDPEETYSIPALKAFLQRECAGQTMTVMEIFERHNIDTPYIERHFKDALKQLEAECQVTVSEPASQRRKNTLADRLFVTFPP